MTWVLGVDPGTISGWGLVDHRGNPIASGQTGRKGSKGKPTQPTTGADIRRVIEQCADEMAERGVVDNLIMAVEGQFLKDAAGRKDKDRYLAVGTFETRLIAGKWIGAAEYAGLEVYHHKGHPTIMSQVWRMGVWGCRPPADKVKAYAVKLTLQAWGLRFPQTQHHTAEALWIAKYVSDLLRFKNRQADLGL